MELIEKHSFCLIQNRYFEDNYCLDYSDKKLTRKGFLFRLRESTVRNTLTLKGPTKRKDGLRYRTEWELTIGDVYNLLSILKIIGFKVIFRYQKYRTIYTYKDVIIFFDETPIGLFLEFEGKEEKILNVTNDLGFNKESLIPFSYYYLFLQYKKVYKIKNRYMLFNKK